MKKKASKRTAKATNRQSTFNFPTSSEADLVAESPAAETSKKSGAKNRRKRTDVSSVPVSSAPTERNKIAQGKKRSAAALGQHPSTTEIPEVATEPSSRAKNRRKRTADFADDADKPNNPHCDSSAISAQSAVKTYSSTVMEDKSVTDNVWPIAPLGQIAEVKLGKMLDKTKHHSGRKFPYLRNVNVRWGVVETHDVFEMYFEDEQVDRFNLEAGDVVVCEGGEPGRAAVWNGQVPEMKFQKAIHRVRFKIPFEPRLLVYFLEWLAKSGQLDRRFTGSTIKHFTRESFVQLPIPCPPISEQHRIVAEIEKQFTRLDAGVAALKRVQANLKRYRAAVLKAACEGKLVPTEAELRRTADDADIADKKMRPSASSAKSAVKIPPFETGEQLLQRILTQRRQNWQGRGQYTEPEAPQTSMLPQLPEGWTWARLEQLGVTYGGLTKNPKRAKLTRQLPYLRVANVYANELRLDDIEYIGVADSELNKLLVQVGDLLIVEGNGSKDQIGRLAIWNGSIESCVHQNHLIKVRPVDPQMPKWILHWLQSPGGRQFVEIVASSTSGLFTLSVNKVGNLMIPLPPLAEQTRIVAEVERRLSVVEELETVVSANLQRAARLRQSILQKAFTGELTGDPTCFHDSQAQQVGN